MNSRQRRLMSEAGDTGELSTVKKKFAPHMWVISRDSGGNYIVTIGDPKHGSSKLKQRFSGKNAKHDLQMWVKYDMRNVVSPNMVFDATGLKLVPEYYTQWYVDNMM